MIKNFMRVMFPKLIDIMFIIGCVGVLIGAVKTGNTAGYFGGNGSAALTFFSVSLAGITAMTVVFGVIYVLLDIRDALQSRDRPE